MPEFNVPLSVLQLLLPAVCTGLLFGGLLLFLYLAIQYKSRLYTAISLFGFTSLLFVASEMIINVWGAWLINRPAGLQFHRIEQLAALYFLFSFPFLIAYLLRLNKTWKKVNYTIAIVGLAIAAVFTTIAFVNPDLFISMTKHSDTYLRLKSQVDYPRGQEGVLYSVRDMLVGALILYGMICITIDLIKHKRKELIPIAIGTFFAIYGAVIDILFIYFHTHFDPFAGIDFSRFSFGLTFMVLILMSGITRRFIQVSKEIEKANEKIVLSEKKYKILAEGTRDCIFSLDESYNFIHANNQALRKLDLKTETLQKTNFFDILYLENDNKDFLTSFIKDKLKTLKQTKKPVSFKAKLKTFLSTEPKTYDLSFNYLVKEEGDEIIGKAILIPEDIFLKYIQTESSRFVIDNYLLTIEEISNRLVDYLPKFMPTQSTREIRMGLREMLINAVEHGNLNISYEEKSKALAEDNYFLFIRERQNQPEYQHKRIIVEYSLSPTKVIYRITDQGRGFDFKKAYQKTRQPTEEIKAHGRGMMMALSVFDKVSYNKSGNSVTLLKEFH
jgi:anti-sigma regulatory factor (Ser/Thr protein kinase)/PAS domain-containing protein